MATTAVTKVLLVDDHPILRTGMRALLEGTGDFRICGEAADHPGALQAMQTSRPDAVIVDIALKNGASGLDLIRRLRAADPLIPILVASMYEESLYATRALAAGAQGYITKLQAPEKIVSALRQVMEGKMCVSDELAAVLMSRAVNGKPAKLESRMGVLSNRELEVFELIGHGNTTSEIARKLKLSVKTIETHRLRIREKLHLADSAKLVREATQWVLENRPNPLEAGAASESHLAPVGMHAAN
jgi:DNA-binding NarL/FixJ family response regulator